MKAMGFPLIYKQGINLLDSVGEHIKIFGSKAMVVADKIVCGLYQERLKKALEKDSINVYFADFS